MKLLILGGTVFLGRHLVEAALARGHTVTLFNRGQSNPDLFPEVEKLRGNRDGALTALQGRRWDAVIDTSGYVPRIVRASVELLAESTNHYTFISSISAYADFSTPDFDESAPVGELSDETIEEIDGGAYGPLKALCEQVVEQAMPGRALAVRPGLIVGPYDPTDRFTYWPHRVAQGGNVLAPGRPERPVQFIDARDLAEWALRMVEAGQTGTYHATGPDYSLTMGYLLETCKAVSKSDARFVWVSESCLLQAGAAPWMELPLWVPESDPDMKYFLQANVSKAISAGLTFRPLAETVQDTLAWDATRLADRQWRAGLKPEREQHLLETCRDHP
jgi:2'-hydroxyisoflavone reductase